MSRVFAFLKKEIVLCISVLAALISCIFVKPSAQYLSYIDVNTLCMLFSFMAVVSGLRSCGVFEKCAVFMSSKTANVRSLSLCMVVLNFVFSMFITNDVALLTFVPFTILLYRQIGQLKWLCYVLVLETIAANLGSMLAPMGNPQNMYLYSVTGMGAGEFIITVLPYTVVAAIMLYVFCLKIPQEKFERSQNNSQGSSSKLKLIVYIALFVLCVVTVVTPIPAWTLAAAVVLIVGIVEWKILLKVDYMLLLTFVAFFIFSGNMQNISVVKMWLEKIVVGNEFFTGLLTSQVISNVPATLLLYNFCKNSKELLLGVDFGGLGTLVASLATLISYKLYSNSGEEGDEVKPQGGSFIKVFGFLSVIFLLVLVAFKFLLGSVVELF